MSSIVTFHATAPWKSARRRNFSRLHSVCASGFGRGVPMTSSAGALPVSGVGTLQRHRLIVRYAPIVTIVLALIAIWYIAAVLMNLSLVRDAFEREETPYTVSELMAGTMSAERPLLPAPTQVIAPFVFLVFVSAPTQPRDD